MHLVVIDALCLEMTCAFSDAAQCVDGLSLNSVGGLSFKKMCFINEDRLVCRLA